MVRADKLELLQNIGNEICEGCGPDRDCGEEYDKCGRIVNAIRHLDEFIAKDYEE